MLIGRCSSFAVVGAHSSISPSNTVTAGPVMSTGAAPPGPLDRQHAAARLDVDPRGRAGRGGCRPTTAAQAPVPQARVSPAPRSQTRSRTARRDDDLHEAGVDAAAESAGGARSAGPALPTGAASTSSTSCTACGLPIDSSATSTVRPALELQRPEREAGLGACARRPGVSNGSAAGSKIGRAHVDRDAAVGGQARLDHAGQGLDARAWSCRSGPCRARSGRSSARRCRTARPRRRAPLWIT